MRGSRLRPFYLCTIYRASASAWTMLLSRRSNRNNSAPHGVQGCATFRARCDSHHLVLASDGPPVGMGARAADGLWIDHFSLSFFMGPGLARLARGAKETWDNGSKNGPSHSDIGIRAWASEKSHRDEWELGWSSLVRSLLDELDSNCSFCRERQ